MMRRTRLNPISKRRREALKTYTPESKRFVEENPQCQIKSKVCSGKSRCVHHKKGRGKFLCDKRYWAASCYPCNGFLETAEGKKWGYENGFRLDRIGNL